MAVLNPVLGGFLAKFATLLEKSSPIPQHEMLLSGCRKRSAAKGVRSLFSFSGRFRSLFLMLLSLSSSLFCRTPFAGLLLRQGDIRMVSKYCSAVFPVLVFQLSKQQNRIRTTSSTVLGTPPNRTRTKKFPLEEL